jgi:predicted ATPase
MKLRRLWIKSYKNLRNCEIEFSQAPWLTAVIGSNGSGKSNLFEALLYILIGVYFKESPPFDFVLDYVTHNREIQISGKEGELSIQVDGEDKPIEFFANRLRDGEAVVYYPELTFVYYSGECQRVRRLMTRYQRAFRRLVRNQEMDRHRPLFVESTNQQAQIILLALFAHGHDSFLRELGITDVVDVSMRLHSPEGFDPNHDEPKLWNTFGTVKRIVDTINETANSEETRRHSKAKDQPSEGVERYSMTRRYRFRDVPAPNGTIRDLANRLAKSGENLYLALEHLAARGIFQSVDYQLKGNDGRTLFRFDHLSEGEKQMIAVVGALRLINQGENLVLLDEPDTHLNPKWSWDYASMLEEAFRPEQRQRSTLLLATHDPVMISGLTREQVLLARAPSEEKTTFVSPYRDPRGQGIANILCSSEFFGLPSSLDRETQKMMDERLAISVKETLTDSDKERLHELNQELEILSPGISDRDPAYVAFLRQWVETRNP